FATSSSTNARSALAAAVASYRSSAASTSASTAARRESIQRSSSGRFAGFGSSGDGAQPKLAFWANTPLYRFLSSKKNRTDISRSNRSSNFRGSATSLEATRKNRTASAP